MAEIKRVRTPLANNTRFPVTQVEPMTINVTLPNGMLVTNPEQFTDEGDEYMAEYSEETTAP